MNTAIYYTVSLYIPDKVSSASMLLQSLVWIFSLGKQGMRNPDPLLLKSTRSWHPTFNRSEARAVDTPENAMSKKPYQMCQVIQSGKPRPFLTLILPDSISKETASAHSSPFSCLLLFLLAEQFRGTPLYENSEQGELRPQSWAKGQQKAT